MKLTIKGKIIGKIYPPLTQKEMEKSFDSNLKID
jgi:hypothetical protein